MGRAVAARLGGELDESPGSAGGALGAQHQRLDVAVEQLLFLVSQRLEFLEHAVEFQLIELEPERADALAESVPAAVDRKSTRLNSSHLVISYAVLCLKKKTGTSTLAST